MLHLYFVTELGADKMTEHILFYKDIYDYHDTNNWNIMFITHILIIIQFDFVQSFVYDVVSLAFHQ